MASELIKAEKVLTIGARLEFYVGEDENKYTSRVEDLEDGVLVVAMPTSKEGVPIIPYKGEQVYGLAMGYHCRYRFMAKFEGHGRIDGNIPVWRVKMPEMVEKFQNREFVRVHVSQTMHVSLINEDGEIGEPVLTWSVDFSGNGISFLMEEPVAENTKAALEIEGIPEIGTLNVMARVVRSVELKRPQGNSAYLIGVSFIDLPKDRTNKIVKWLFAVQRRAIAKGVSV